MIALAFIAGACFGGLAGILWARWEHRHDGALELWAVIREKEQDIRALTESLVRAEGKPLVFGPPRELRKGQGGWFDSKPLPPALKITTGSAGTS